MSSRSTTKQKINKRRKSHGKPTQTTLNNDISNGTRDQTFKLEVTNDSQEAGHLSQSSKLNIDLYKYAR